MVPLLDVRSNLLTMITGETRRRVGVVTAYCLGVLGGGGEDLSSRRACWLVEGGG